MTGKIDVWALAKELRRPKTSLLGLTEANDPFHVEIPYRRRNAEWIAALWPSLNFPLRVHPRRAHYRLTALDIRIPTEDGHRYENTVNDAKFLGCAIRDAIYLDLLSPETTADHKNPDPLELLFEEEESPARLWSFDSALNCFVPTLSYSVADITLPSLPSLPGLATAWLTRPKIAQRYHVEIWCEKSTMNDILEPLGRRHGVNIITGTGELSAVHCRNFVDRIVASGRPAARVCYVSDFDPKGRDMPVSVGVKIQFELLKRGLELDVEVSPTVLTHDQCTEWNLPRTPTKKSDRSSARFEEQFGEGQTELDALEALYPGRLEEILTAKIMRYRRDPTLDKRIDEVAWPIETKLRQLVKENNEAIEPEHAKLRAELEPIREELNELNEEFEREINEIIADFGERASVLRDRAIPIFDQTKAVCEAARLSLDEKLPDIREIEWPTAASGDEDPDPLFSSRRDYVEQVNRFKLYQRKPAGRKERQRPPPKVYDTSTAAGRKRATTQAWYEANREQILAKRRPKQAPPSEAV